MLLASLSLILKFGTNVGDVGSFYNNVFVFKVAVHFRNILEQIVHDHHICIQLVIYGICILCDMLYACSVIIPNEESRPTFKLFSTLFVNVTTSFSISRPLDMSISKTPV